MVCSFRWVFEFLELPVEFVASFNPFLVKVLQTRDGYFDLLDLIDEGVQFVRIAKLLLCYFKS